MEGGTPVFSSVLASIEDLRRNIELADDRAASFGVLANGQALALADTATKASPTCVTRF
jgi:hypothetical protein